MKNMKTNTPDYKRIFKDILKMKYPEKKEECNDLLSKKELSMLDIIKLNQTIFKLRDKENFTFNQKHRSYNKKTILEILDYQKKHHLNNSQTAIHFNLSRNTLTKWQKMFQL